MPYKDFKKDLKDAATPGRYPHLSGIKAGEYDASVAFTFNAPNGPNISLEAIVSDTTQYPASHTLLVITTSDNPMVNKALKLETPFFKSATVNQFLKTVDQVLFEALVHDRVIRDSPSGDNEFDTYEQDDDSEEYNDGFEWTWESPPENEAVQKLIRRDLRAAKAAGFRTGFYPNVHGSSQGVTLLCISCRISRLNISDEVMQAWNVHRDEYLVLLMLYPVHYKGMGYILDTPASSGYQGSVIQMRVGLCDSYKPTLEHAEQVFKTTRHPPPAVQGTPLKHLFIGTSLNKLLNDRLVPIARYRVKYNLTWTAAELYYHSVMGKATVDSDKDGRPPYVADTWDTPAPPPLVFDHFPLTEKDLGEASFPLVAMQFTLRHLVKCNGFCAVCHCKVSNELDAVKPFVCANQLCLYQYMTLNMGLSIDHEVMSQPKVVDLLIYLAYGRARRCLLDDFPIGLGLMVPDMTLVKYGKPEDSDKCIAELDKTERVLVGEDLKLSVGDWIIIFHDEKSPNIHCRVEEIDPSRTHASLSSFIWDRPKPANTDFGTHVRYQVYSQLFDDLPREAKLLSVMTLLNTLPSVDSMKNYLKDCFSVSLSSWRNRISPSAFTLLRWIVASNRSCIMLDEDPKNLVSDMYFWRQFRIIGTPEKELSFAQNVQLHGNKQFPTIFAWHGSPVHNWHAILREGLNFQRISNGRSFGDGVYFSDHMRTSLTYVTKKALIIPTTLYPEDWIAADSSGGIVMSLNEIVNSTKDFVSTRPHLVVNQLNWIQPRYLFFQVMTDRRITPEPSHIYNQDPNHVTQGTAGPVQIPISAIAQTRRKDLHEKSKSPKKSKIWGGRPPGSKNMIRSPSPDVMIDSKSIATDDEDRMILLSDNESSKGNGFSDLSLNAGKKRSENGIITTDTENNFVPGTLRNKSLSLLESPKFANPVATRLLQRQLQTTLKVQKKEKSHDLGWYIDPELIITPYQWIVELHSFDPELPLAKDMKKAEIKSIVLEMRFPASYPMDPPFVRVITPKLLEFANGGGGHVTTGGSMCLELLTSSGWLPTFSIENVLIQIRMALCNTEPQPARLGKNPLNQYDVANAIAGYQRVAHAHGWNIPGDMSWIKNMK
ncbi:hypothetical protein N7495_009519 [Penicillium taxi]|uniref:uncharacterized protein n=1 Tax=Penicillium taxi TaxID=168475 RepID=UPI00254574C0|nr:uncharacterized protein N7495_009519 [Penicillium taxi]KAJ5885009.1 hypothetical protein N7495_009519 [Penicillium taxi]